MTDASYAAAKAIDASAIPVIDIGALRGGGSQAVAEVAEKIREASATVGFFYVRNHGIDPAVRDAALAAAMRFFALPPEVKSRVAVDRRHRGFLGAGRSAHALEQRASRDVLAGDEVHRIQPGSRWSYIRSCLSSRPNR